MTNKNVNFELVPDVDSGQTDVALGRGTSFVRKESLNGVFGEKTAREYGPFAMDAAKWFERQKRAAQISNELRALGNPLYDVPKTFISHGHVREQFIDGVRADKYAGDKTDFIPAVANFINDMSELRPAYFRRNYTVPGVLLHSVAELDKELDTIRKFNVVSDENLQLIRDVYEFLRDMPENNMFVFGHNDLHPGNVLIDPETGRLSVIDFELAGYRSMAYTLYVNMRAGSSFWDYVNNLKRTKNSGLKWNYDARVADLYRFLDRVLSKIENVSLYDKDMSARVLKSINDLCNPVFRKKFGSLKLKYQGSLVKNEMSLVPMSHYER